MKYSLMIILALWLPDSSLLGEGEGEPEEPMAAQVVLRPGLNAVAVTRFSLQGADGTLAKELSLPAVFGQRNEAGLSIGDAQSADLVWVAVGQGEWARFYYTRVPSPNGQGEEGWRRLDGGNRDASQFRWPYTAGMLIERRRDAPHSFAIEGVVRRTPTELQVSKGRHYFNRVLDGPVSLAELNLEEFFVRAPVEVILGMAAEGPGGPRPGEQFDGDQFLDPESGESFVLSESGEWYLLGTGKKVDPARLLVPGAFGIERVGGPATIKLVPPPVVTEVTPVKLQRQPFLGLNEGAVRALRVEDLGPPECTCAFLLHNNRPIALYVVESDGGNAIVRVGKHPDNVVTDTLAIASGEGVIGRFESGSDFLRVEREVRSFSGNEPIEEPQPFVVRLPNPEKREGEVRFFSNLDPSGRLNLLLNRLDWQAESLLEIDLIFSAPENRKVALHLPRVRLAKSASAVEVGRALANMLSKALVERQLVPAAQLEIIAVDRPDGTMLSLGFGVPIERGKVDLCLIAPPPAPSIDQTSSVVVEGGFIEIQGKDFGRRIDDLCLVLAPTDGVGSSIPLRPVSLSPDGTRILARVVGPIPDGRSLQVMLARGVGRTRPIHLGLPDVILRQGIWVWRGNGAPAVISPNVVQPALGQGEDVQFVGSLNNGSLELVLDQAWPENAEISIAFTANTETVQLDSYAPELCFTVTGSTVECAKRLQRVLEAAFVQGGMADANQVQVELIVNGDEVVLSVNVFTDDGVNDPITSGLLIVSVKEGTIPCTPPDPEDTDGDLVQDSWEMDLFSVAPEMVDALADPDADEVLNHMEFAFSLDPFVPNDITPLNISMDEENHPLITYQRHVAAPNFYNFSVETSMDGDLWQSLPNLEIFAIQPLGLNAETVVARCLIDAHQLGASFYRLKVTPRS